MMTPSWSSLRCYWPAVVGAAVAAFLLGGAIQSDPNGLFGAIVAAWVQAIGTILALVIAIVLPRIEARARRRQFGESVLTLAREAHGGLAATWFESREGTGDKDTLMDLADHLRARAVELDAIPWIGSPSARAVGFVRELAACARGPADAIEERREDLGTRSFQIANYGHHLLALLAREFGLAEPPAPVTEAGVPPHILAEYRGERAGVDTWVRPSASQSQRTDGPR